MTYARGDTDVRSVGAAKQVSIDPRAERTRRAILDAVGQLTAQGLTPISVSDVVRQARVSRSSFYVHFSSLDEVAVGFLREEFDAIGSADLNLLRVGGTCGTSGFGADLASRVGDAGVDSPGVAGIVGPGVAGVDGAGVGGAGVGVLEVGGSDVSGSDVGGSDVGGSDVGGSDVGGSDVGGSDVGCAGIAGSATSGVRATGRLSGAETARIGYQRLVGHLISHDSLYACVLGLPLSRQAYDEAVTAYAREMLQNLVELSPVPKGVIPEMAATYLAGGSLMLISSWLRGTPKMSADELIDQLVALLPPWLDG